jgi:hypothetical protein
MKTTRRKPARINAVIRGTAKNMTVKEREFRRFTRAFPGIQAVFNATTLELVEQTGKTPTAVGTLGFVREKLRNSLVQRGRGKRAVLVEFGGVKNDLAPYFARRANVDLQTDVYQFRFV